ncbi:MAG: trigger factor [Solirubrobacterales bacterium]
MKTKVDNLGDSRLKIEVDVPAAELEKAIQKTAARLGKEMKIPGFRKGKVPPQMVIQKVSRGAVMTEAIEDNLADWYSEAVLDARVEPVGNPSIKMETVPGEAEPLKFSIEVSVLPVGKLEGYRGLEVGKEEIEVPPGTVDAEVDRLREGFAKLNTVEREARQGDVLLIDFEGQVDGETFEGGEGKDYLLELGRGQVVPGFEEALAGAKAGDRRQARFDFPDDYHAEQLRGKKASFEIEVKEVREKELPELDDDFAAEASEFDTVEELRDHITERVREVLEGRAEEGFRERALDAAADKVEIELSDDLISGRAAENWARAARSLTQQGIDPDRYLEAQSVTREELVEQSKPEAERSLRREAALEAVAEAEGIEITEEEMLEALKPPPGHEDHGHPEPSEALKELRESGREKLVERDLKIRKALDVIASSAKPIPLEQAEAREKIWTPEKEPAKKGAGLWTPGDPK